MMFKPYLTYHIHIINPRSVRVNVIDSTNKIIERKTYPFELTTDAIVQAEKLNIKIREDEISEEDLRRLAELLFKALFNDGHRNDFIRYYDRIKNEKGKYLRLELEIDEGYLPQIAAMPWECMRVPKEFYLGEIWLATDEIIAFSRRRIYGRTPIKKLKKSEKLTISLAIAPTGGAVAYEHLEKDIREFVKKDSLKIGGIGNPANIQEINRVASEIEPNIFHFIGHGIFKDGMGEIILSDDTRLSESQPIDAENFCELISRQITIIFLQACNSGELSKTIPFIGFASQVSQNNYPVVIGMQYEISNSNAKIFALEFYKNLMEFEPVDLAVQKARRKIKIMSGQPWAFVTPVLFMSVDNGDLYEAQEGKPPIIPEPPLVLDPVIVRGLSNTSSSVKKRKIYSTFKNVLLKAFHEETQSHVISLVGDGGFGKTTLANAVYDDEGIANQFKGGIIWIKSPNDLEDILLEVTTLYTRTSRRKANFKDLNEAVKELTDFWTREELQGRKYLLILDDVKNVENISSFLLGGDNNVARVITTRSEKIALELNSELIRVGEMTLIEARDLVLHGLRPILLNSDEELLNELIRQLDYWPLALSLVNSCFLGYVIQKGYGLGKTIKHSLILCDESETALVNAMKILFDWLKNVETEDDELINRFQELAIFPPDLFIPIHIIQKLWHVTSTKKSFDFEETITLLEKLKEVSLILEIGRDTKQIRIHDEIQAYLIEQNDTEMWHRQFLDSYGLSDWSKIPMDETYLWQHLGFHLMNAGEESKFREVVKNFNYLVKKVIATNVNSVESDLKVAYDAAPGDTTISYYQDIFSQFGYGLSRCENMNDALSTLYSRVKYQDFKLDIEKSTPPYLEPIYTLPDLPHPNLIRTIEFEALPPFQEKIDFCKISSDGKVLVAASFNASVLTIWERDLGIERFTIAEYPGQIDSCGVNHDGSKVVIASDKMLKIWDGKTSRLIEEIKDGYLTKCAISMNGNEIVAIDSNEGSFSLQIFKSNGGKYKKKNSLPLELSAGHIKICKISPDGRYVVVTGTKELIVFDIINGIEVFRKRVQDIPFDIEKNTEGITYFIQDCAIAGDADLVFIALRTNNNNKSLIKWWDIKTDEESLYEVEQAITSCSSSKNGKRLVVATKDGILRILDTTKNKVINIIEGHVEKDEAIILCDVAGNEMFISAGGPGDRTIRIWKLYEDTFTKKKSYSISKRIKSKRCVISSDGQYVVTATAIPSLEIWQINLDDQVIEHVYQILTGGYDELSDCILTPDKNYVISTSPDKGIQIWRFNDEIHEEIIGVKQEEVKPSRCVIHLPTSLLVTVENTRLKLWEVKSDSEAIWIETKNDFLEHKSFVTDCCISPKGDYLITASADNVIIKWDPIKRERLETFEGHTKRINACEISYDGKFMVSASLDSTLKIWRADNPKEVKTLVGHRDRVNGCSINFDRSLIASVSSDNTLKVWNFETGKCLSTIVVDGQLNDCSWFPDGKHLVSVGENGTYFWRFVDVDEH